MGLIVRGIEVDSNKNCGLLLLSNIGDVGRDGEGPGQQQQGAGKAAMQREIEPVLQLTPHKRKSALTERCAHASGPASLRKVVQCC